MTKWFSIRKADFDKTLFFGIGFGGDIPRIEVAVIIVVGERVICIGPHK
jgi:hypothetical protein